MSDLMKLVLIGLAAMYVISPVDGVPGSVDDFIVIALALLASRTIGEHE